MPTQPEILGFGNEWYALAHEAAIPATLPSGSRIRMVTGPYFLATKLSAFEGRGQSDFVMSYDMEDIVAVLDGRPEIVGEVAQSGNRLRSHLVSKFADFRGNQNFIAAVSGHLPGDAASQARVPLVLNRISEIAGLI